MLYSPDRKDIKAPKWRGLVTGATVDGGCPILINFDVTDGGDFLTRCDATNSVDDITGVPAGRGLRNIWEHKKSDGTRYTYIDVAEDPGLSITKPATQPTLTEATDGSGAMIAESYGSVTYEASLLNSTEKDKSISLIYAYGNTFCNQTKYTNAGQTHTNWADSSVTFEIEIDGKDAAKDRDGNLVDTYKYNHGGGDVQTGIPMQTNYLDNKQSHILSYVWVTIRGRRLKIPNIRSTAYGLAIGKSSGWFDYSDVVARFKYPSGHCVGDKWSFSLNPSGSGYVAEGSITFTEGGLNDVTTSGDYTGTKNRDFVVEVDATGTPDTFRWSKDGGKTWDATGVSMAATVALGSTGCTIACAATTGHKVGNRWSFPAYAGRYSGYYTYATYTGAVCTGETDPSPVTNVTVTGSNNAILFKWTDSAETYDKVNIYRTLADDDSGTAYFVTTGTKGNGTTGVTITDSDATIRANREMPTSIQDTILMYIGATTNTSTAASGVAIGSWTTLTDRQATAATTIPCWANANENAYRADGVNANKVIKNNSTIYDMGVVAPAVAPVCSSTTGGDLLEGDYEIYYTYIKYYGDSGLKIESDPSPPTYVTVTGDAIDITHIKSYQPGVDYIRIYRNLNGTTGTYWKCQEVANAAATTTLIRSDDEINTGLTDDMLDTDNDVPPKVKYIEHAGARMWYANAPDEDNGEFRLWWSKAHKPEQVPALNYAPLKSRKPITGLKAYRNSLLIFTGGTVHRVHDVYADTPSVIDMFDIGCVDFRTIQEWGDGRISWVSHEGVIVYDGTKLRNISFDLEGRDRVYGRILKSYIDAGAEWHSGYDSTKRQHHLLTFTWNAAETAIVDHKHLVYSLDTDSWSERQYKDSDGNRLYPTSMGIITDDKDRDILMMSTITGLTGTTAHFTQVNYDAGETGLIAEIPINVTGVSGTAIDRPTGSVIDSNDNAYVVTYGDGTTGGAIFKIDSTYTASVLATPAQIKTAISGETDELNLYSPVIDDTVNNCIYCLAVDEGAASEVIHILKSTYAGVLTDIGTINGAGTNVFDHTRLAVDSEGSLYYTTNVSGTTGRITKISDPGGGSEATTTYRDSTTNTKIVEEIYMDSSDNLWFVELTGSTYGMCKLTDVTGSADYAQEFTTTTPIGKHVSTDGNTVYFASTNFYWNWGDDEDGCTAGTIYKATQDSSGAWTETSIATLTQHYKSDNSQETINDPDTVLSETLDNVTDIAVDGFGTIIFSGYSSTDDAFNTYRLYEDFETISLVYSASGTMSTDTMLIGLSVDSKNTIIACVYDFGQTMASVIYNNDYAYFSNITPGSTTASSDSWTHTSEVKLQTSYTDLGNSTYEKSIDMIQFPVESKNATCGWCYSQAGYDTRRQVHSGSDYEEPTGSKTGYHWSMAGERSWETDSKFDTSSGSDEIWEHREIAEIPMDTHGRVFRCMIIGGTTAGSYDGRLKIGVPTIWFRVKGRKNE